MKFTVPFADIVAAVKANAESMVRVPEGSELRVDFKFLRGGDERISAEVSVVPVGTPYATETVKQPRKNAKTSNAGAEAPTTAPEATEVSEAQADQAAAAEVADQGVSEAPAGDVAPAPVTTQAAPVQTAPATNRPSLFAGQGRPA